MLELVLAPDAIYKKTCAPVTQIDDAVRATLQAMMETVEGYDALGISAPMVGLNQRLVTVALEDETGRMHRYKMVNPTITKRSAETSTMEEASITFLGVSAPVTRPAAVTVEYLDENGTSQTIDAQGIIAVCLQHEIDYLDGKTFIDYQSPMKRDMLTRKMEKQKRHGPHPHVHGAHCNH